jgi:valyl-tRNA synthetase
MNRNIQIKQTKEYIEFLEKRLNSKHFLSRATPEEITKTKDKLKKARLVVKVSSEQLASENIRSDRNHRKRLPF